MNEKKSEKKPISYKKVSGRPSIYYSDEEVHELGKELLEWLEQTNENVWHLSDWYYGVKKMLHPEWETLRQRKDFLRYYKIALERMGTFMMKNQKMPTAYGSRFLSLYFAEVRQHEKEISLEKIDHEYALKDAIETKKSASPNDAKLDELIQTLKASDFGKKKK